ncbi:MAG: ribosomal protein S18-alanine N-acetyltransferase [Armatimonadetes bacterium]|nr:ribosomal protein S18-alanine N-acetyltransferase [Armatimonadota bacterium]
MAGYQVEPMLESHMAAVMELERICNPAPWSESSFQAELSNHQATYLVATHNTTLVGFAGYWSIIDEAHVTNIAVHPNHRRNGVGRLLMERILEAAKTTDHTCSTLEVRAGNVAAITLYEKLGFVRCGLRKGYYPKDKEDAVVMWLYGLT